MAPLLNLGYECRTTVPGCKCRQKSSVSTLNSLGLNTYAIITGPLLENTMRAVVMNVATHSTVKASKSLFPWSHRIVSKVSSQPAVQNCNLIQQISFHSLYNFCKLVLTFVLVIFMKLRVSCSIGFRLCLFYLPS